MQSEYREAILETITNSRLPLHVEIQTLVGISNFQTAKAATHDRREKRSCNTERELLRGQQLVDNT